MKKLLLSILCIGVLFASCDDDNKIEEVDKNYHAKEFIKESKEKFKQEFTLNTTDLPKTILLKEGVKITIPPNVLTKGGTPITGNFTVEAYEMLKPSSIIFSGTNTNYIGNKIFESDGFIFIDVKQGGASVDKKLAGYLDVSIPTPKEDGTWTGLWIGEDKAGTNENQFAWTDPEMEDIANMNVEIRGAWANKNYFDFGLGKLGWVNCDIFWGEDKEMTTVTVELTGNIGKLASYMALDGDTYVFFCAKKATVVAQLYDAVNATTVKSYDNSLPIGGEGKMVAFSVKEGIFSYASQDITITKDLKLTLDLKAVTKAELETYIKALDSYK